MPLAIGLPERRRKNRARIEIHSRDPANSLAARAWRAAKDSTWLLLLLMAALLLYFLVSVIREVFSPV